MKLVCFSNNTAGGLVCNLLNKQKIIFNGYKTKNQEHNLLKFEDTPTICNSIDDKKLWYDITNKYKVTDLWYGTHVHPSGIPNINDYEEILTITTQTEKSKLYRWLRYYYGWYYTETVNWREDDTLEKIDKIRELSKNVFVEFKPYNNLNYVEFEEIVNGNFVKNNGLDQVEFANWKSANNFLYDSCLNNWGTKRFYEAQYELRTNKPFKYI